MITKTIVKSSCQVDVLLFFVSVFISFSHYHQTNKKNIFKCYVTYCENDVFFINYS